MSKLKFILLLLILLITGCKSGMDSMLEDYNGNFTVDYDVMNQFPSPGDPDFDEKQMLWETYCVGSHETVNLAGPYKCDSYNWVVTDPLNDEEVTVKYFDGTYICNQRQFVTYIPESGLEIGKTYRLTLTVSDKDGNLYSDVCELVIYQHYEFD